MRSFTIALLAAFVTFTSAIPVPGTAGATSDSRDLLGGATNKLEDHKGRGLLDGVTGATEGHKGRGLLDGVTGATEGHKGRGLLDGVTGATEGHKGRGLLDGVAGAAEGHKGRGLLDGVTGATEGHKSRSALDITREFDVGQGKRSDAPSIPDIFWEVTSEIQPLVDELTWLDAHNITVDICTEIVAKIKTSVDAAIPKVKALAGADDSAKWTGSDGKVYALSDVAVIVGGVLNLIFRAVAKVLVVVSVRVDIAADIQKIFVNLGLEITALIQVVVDVCVGLTLKAQVQGIADVIAKLHLDTLAKLCGLSS